MGAVAKAVCSKASMNMLAAIGETGLSMAVPYNWRKILPQLAKSLKIARRQSLVSSQ